MGIQLCKVYSVKFCFWQAVVYITNIRQYLRLQSLWFFWCNQHGVPIDLPKNEEQYFVFLNFKYLVEILKHFPPLTFFVFPFFSLHMHQIGKIRETDFNLEYFQAPAIKIAYRDFLRQLHVRNPC